MQVTEKKNEGLKREFEIKLLAKDINKKVEIRLEEVSKTVKAPGFRPGKVPLALVKKKHGQQVLGEVLESAVEESSRKVMEDNKVFPAGKPDIKVESFNEGEDLVYSMAFEVYPEVPETDFSKVKLERSVVEIIEKDIDDAIEKLRQSQKESTPLKTDRKTKKGDIVVIDFLGKVGGEAFEGGESKNYNLELGSGQFIPGFEDQLKGLNKGDETVVKVKFPDEYGSENLAGKDAEFEVTLHDILTPKLPKVDDKFAEKLGMENVEKLREEIKTHITKDFDQITRTKLKKDLFDALDKKFKFELPQSMLDVELGSLTESLKDVKDEKEVKKQTKEFEKLAERRVRLGIVLADFARKSSVDVTEDEVRAAVFDQARSYPGQEQMVLEYYQKNPQALEQLRGPLLEEKAVDLIISKATIKDKKTNSAELIKFNEQGE